MVWRTVAMALPPFWMCRIEAGQSLVLARLFLKPLPHPRRRRRHSQGAQPSGLAAVEAGVSLFWKADTRRDRPVDVSYSGNFLDRYALRNI